MDLSADRQITLNVKQPQSPLLQYFCLCVCDAAVFIPTGACAARPRGVDRCDLEDEALPAVALEQSEGHRDELQGPL